MGAMRHGAPLLSLWLVAACLTGGAAATDCGSDGQLVCGEPGGCYNETAQACAAGLDTEPQCTAQGLAWGSAQSCRCECHRIFCEMGCYDTEDEACHPGLNEMGCAEIYGHVEWSGKCLCRLEGLDYISNSTAEEKSTALNLYFSIPAFIVLFRESLEVVIVLVVIIQFLIKSRDNGMITQEMFCKFRREVYLGASMGFLCCLILGVGFLALASLAFNLFKGDGRLIFEGSMMIVTAIVLTFLALNFYKMVHTMRGHERKMKKQVEQVLAACKEAEGLDGQASFSRKHAFLVFAFSVGLREGLESILFLVGVVSDVKDLSSLPLPIITALILARVVGCCFFQGTKKMNVAWFMRGSAFLLLFIAAGFFTSSVHSFQELGVFGTWSPKSQRSWQNQMVWDTRSCCNDKTNRFFVLVRALFGYQDQPSPIEFFAYATYWATSTIVGAVVVRRAKKELEQLIIKWSKMDEEEAKMQKMVECETPPEVIGDRKTEPADSEVAL